MMYRESSSELDDLSAYRCPKCSRSFSSLHNLRDHLDIVHLHQPTRDTDDENCSVTEPILESLSKDRVKHPPRGSGHDAAEINRQLRLAKELELRHKILHRHTKSEDELKALNDEILQAKQRQYEMCNIIHNAKEQIDNLRLSAEKVTADQQRMIDRLKEQLHVKDNQLEKSTAELRGLIELRRGLQDDVQALAQERENHRHRLEEIYNELQRKEQHIGDKQREVESLQTFIQQASKKEMAARQKLEEFINGLLDRAEMAEGQVRKMKKQLSLHGMAPGVMQKSVSDNQLNQTEELPPGGIRPHHRSHSADPMMSMPYPRSSDVHPMTPTYSPHAPRSSSQPQYTYPVTPEYSPQSYNTPVSRKLPSGPFPKDFDYYAYPVQAPDDIVASVSQNYGKPLKSRRDFPDGSKAASRYDDRPESGYGSVHPGTSRPQSRLSSVSERSNASTDTVVPAYNHHEDCMQNRRSPSDSHRSDEDNEVFQLNMNRDLPIDDEGIMWEDDHCGSAIQSHKSHPSSRKIKPKLTSELKSSKPSKSANKKKGPSPLQFSRMSSINSLERDILTDINDQTKFEMQRYKFLLRDRMQMLKEQEKLLDEDVWSDSDLTSVTSNDSLLSLTFTSFSEFSDDEHDDRKWKKSKVKSPLMRKRNVKRLVSEKPKPIGIVPQAATRPVTLTPPSVLKAKSLSVSNPSAFHSPVNSMAKSELPSDPATVQRHCLLFLIFNYLDTRSLSRVSIICHEWREISRHPALWRKVVLTKYRISTKFLLTISQWCCTMKSLTLEGLRPRPKKTYETNDEYKRKTRGSLEEGLDALLKASQRTLMSIRIVDCSNLLTERCLWLCSCYCHDLRRVTYISNTESLGSEVIWSLGAGCRDISRLIVPPLYPIERVDRFNNLCVKMISWCWPELQILSIGGQHISKKGLLEIARNCKVLQTLELHQMKPLTDETSIAMCHVGLHHLEVLDIVFTPVAPSTVRIFVDSCPRLKSLKIHLNMSNYYSNINNFENRKAFGDLIKQIEVLKKYPAIEKVLTVQADYK